MASNQRGALEAQSLAGVVVGIGHLAVGDPDHRLARSGFGDRPREHRTINAVADIARGVAASEHAVMNQDPGVGSRHHVTGPVAVPDHERPRGSLE
jgi:hypothetical protein